MLTQEITKLLFTQGSHSERIFSEFPWSVTVKGLAGGHLSGGNEGGASAACSLSPTGFHQLPCYKVVENRVNKKQRYAWSLLVCVKLKEPKQKTPVYCKCRHKNIFKNSNFFLSFEKINPHNDKSFRQIEPLHDALDKTNLHGWVHCILGIQSHINFKGFEC